MALVLVVSAADDWSATAVADQLAARDVPYAWADPADFPQRLELSATFDTRWHTQLHTDGRTVELDEVTAVFYRRPNDFRIPAGMSGPEERFARSQARVGLGGILAALHARWVNHPSALADHEYKPRQLALAARVGLTVPRTLVTNRADDVRAFGKRVGELVVKPLADPIVNEAGTYTPVWTRRVAADELDDLAGVETTAHLFQAWVDKDFEVRLIAAGDRLMPVAIRASSQTARVDWRSDYDALSYEPIACPAPVAASVRRYMAAAGLAYGALDFVVDHAGVWHFLEMNAAGQWGWLADKTGIDVAGALADVLTGGSPWPNGSTW
ncbi:ATP-grasp ribosomal peptide maturase [Actinocatenispora comari]|uniref:ATP-grasp ribosomal peptide maturase n=1 Tax=Actinocatenispora comari TaxID=2807577 RepID=A0A8J4AIT3_9ACTN|nr:ATP-grasp ribosomal peptide maturase [Actinocatenispora comari]GIL32041.1 ATP-grasp ribosomal peptide maturase [Actinocatenispora comari]